MEGNFLNDPNIKKFLDNRDPIAGDLSQPTYDMVVTASTDVLDSTDKIKMIAETNESFRNMIGEFNARYGLDVQVDLENLGGMLKFIIDPKNKRIMELYTSEFFGRFRTIIYLKMTQSIMILTDSILNANFLLSNSVSYADKFAIIEKLLDFIKSVEEIYSNVKINASDLELERIADSSEATGAISNTSPEVKNFLEHLKNSIVSK